MSRSLNYDSFHVSVVLLFQTHAETKSERRLKPFFLRKHRHMCLILTYGDILFPHTAKGHSNHTS